MATLADIPAEKRWEIAARSASAIPLLYGMIFRKALGDRYDKMELQIWVEGAKGVKNLAKSLGMPSKNAREISETFEIVGTILFGPEFRIEMIEESRDRTVGKVVECPVLNRAREMGLDPEVVNLTACRTYGRWAVESLNPEYTRRLNKSMCGGDEFCEMIVERRR